MGIVHAKEAPVKKTTAVVERIIDDEKGLQLGSVPARVQKVLVDGVGRTKDDIVIKQVGPLFGATNFEEMVKCAEETRNHMEELGLFKKVGVFIDVYKGQDARDDGYEITYSVNETRRVAGGISTLVGTNDGTLLLQCKLPNMLGRGEQLTAEYTCSTKSKVGNAVNFVKPFVNHPKISFSMGGYQFCGDHPWSTYKEMDRGLSAGYSFPTWFGDHTLKWEAVWREMRPLSALTAFAVREQAGHSSKSSIKHTFLRDTRDNIVIPNTGYMMRVQQELAGLGGDVKHVKHEIEAQINKRLILDTVVQFSLAGGLMRSIQPGDDILIIDRFFLGGPLTLRGFGLKTVGPRSDGSSLGADTYWLAGAHLYTPLPFHIGKTSFGRLFRTHFFANAGNLANIDFSSADWKERVTNMALNIRAAYGIGVVLNMGGVARLELNYCFPIHAHEGDVTNSGVQFGIGINFL